MNFLGEEKNRRFRIQFAINMLTVMFAFWVFRQRVGYVEFNELLLLWVFFPVAALVTGFCFRKRPRAARIVFAFSVEYCAFYPLYCLPGDEGNTLPLLFAPPALFILSFLLVPLIVIVDGWLTEAWTFFLSRRYGSGNNETPESKV